MTEPMIRLEGLTKRYPGQEHPAVEALDLDVPAGEIVILVGPSGCGKTTTMKMVNRIIEPTAGRILLEGEDVTRVDPDRLRRRIGYVIQQVGLFPHMTIAQNVATVPRLLGWPRQRVAARTDELLELVGLDPAAYRDRYPKALSGGQRQRVGVARALAADPPVMLMDEPFGALDPISRERLQNEFLRLQEEIRKTIVFVTHDIDEAIKMGDRIAILRERSVVAQYDTPENVLSAPADDFVREFIGSGASLKRLGLARVRDFALADRPVALMAEGPAAALAVLQRSGADAVLLLDDERRPRRWAGARDLARAADDPAGGARALERVGMEVRAVVEPQATLAGALDAMLTSRVGGVVVVDPRGAYLGAVDMSVIMAAAETMRAAARQAAGGDGAGDGPGARTAEGAR
ncbi:betaine/proline/choline family ABC transporter ATP-binding protein [Vallicoccus soli]|uniref:ABC-type quaternary amine transporter n=1 Tax=Vallicoccus soli TaxID=2339232 RepID=A0A3A3YWV2_9ACTN|nr:betaine/proline/choline family ABC transporter ATP-binding protein [Vallicoccus soli]RJK96088.1 ATP-binding cassette domain-containing protein [Vallicoccus soli]